MLKLLVAVLFLAAMYQSAGTQGERGSVHTMRATMFALAAIAALCFV